VKKYEENKKDSEVHEDKEPFMMTFSSQEEAELFRLKRNMNRSDMQKFQLFCRMMRTGKMLSNAKIHNKS